MKNLGINTFSEEDLSNISKWLKKYHQIEVLLVENEKCLPESKIAVWTPGKLIVHKNKRGLLGATSMIAHMFGHLVIYSQHPKLIQFASKVEASQPPITVNGKYRKRYLVYEHKASGYGLSLLENSIKQNLTLGKRISFQAYMDADFELFWHWVLTGIILDSTHIWTIYLRHFSKLSSDQSRLIKANKIPNTLNLNISKISAI